MQDMSNNVHRMGEAYVSSIFTPLPSLPHLEYPSGLRFRLLGLVDPKGPEECEEYMFEAYMFAIRNPRGQ
jgi:hypothetical protein